MQVLIFQETIEFQINETHLEPLHQMSHNTHMEKIQNLVINSGEYYRRHIQQDQHP